MTTAEPSPPDAPGADPGATEAWLRGLAGEALQVEAGSTSASAASAEAPTHAYAHAPMDDLNADHAEGARLRRALDGVALTQPPHLDWADVQARAGLRLQSVPEAAVVMDDAAHTLPANAPQAQPPSTRHRGTWRAWPALGLAASAMMAAVLWWPATQEADQDADAGWRGEQGTPTWVSPQPEADAAALAAELRAFGAQVSVLPEATGSGDAPGASAAMAGESKAALRLDIRCAAPCDARVHERLQLLETGLDGRGELVLRVVAGR